MESVLIAETENPEFQIFRNRFSALTDLKLVSRTLNECPWRILLLISRRKNSLFGNCLYYYEQARFELVDRVHHRLSRGTLYRRYCQLIKDVGEDFSPPENQWNGNLKVSATFRVSTILRSLNSGQACPWQLTIPPATLRPFDSTQDSGQGLVA